MVPFLWRRGAKREPGRAKHQEPGWFVQLPIIGGLNQPPRLRPRRRLRGIFLMGAPLLVQGGDFGFPFSCFQCPRVQQKMWDMASLFQEGNSDSRFASTTYLRTKREVEGHRCYSFTASLGRGHRTVIATCDRIHPGWPWMLNPTKR